MPISNLLAWSGGLLLPQAVGWTSAWITKSEVKGDWYQGLKKPWYNPPNLVFPITWTAMYGAMGAASVMIWNQHGGLKGNAVLPLSLYAAQLVANGLWSPLFFGKHKTGTALLDILILDALVAACVATFLPVNQTAGLLMIPYLAWVSFATLLNYRIWKDNDATDKSN